MLRESTNSAAASSVCIPSPSAFDGVVFPLGLASFMLSSLATACMDLKLAISASILLSLACMASTSCMFGVRGWDDMKANMICYLEVVFAIEVGRVEVINIGHG